MKQNKTSIRTLISTGSYLGMLFFTLMCSAQTPSKEKMIPTSYPVKFREKSGQLDSICANPKPDQINLSDKCVRYRRNSEVKYDYIKLGLSDDLKISMIKQIQKSGKESIKYCMKFFTNAPSGTPVELLIGKNSGEKDYPDGTLGHFRASTTVSGKWEQLEFSFIQTPEGSAVTIDQIDQITLLLNPNSSSADLYYFEPKIIPLTKTNSTIKTTRE